MKRITVYFMALVMAVQIMSTTSFAATSKDITVNFIYKDSVKTVTYPDVKPFLYKNNTMISVRAFVEAFGGKIITDPKKPKDVTVVANAAPGGYYQLKGKITIVFTLNSRYAVVNGVKKDIFVESNGAVPMLYGKEKRFCVPAKFLAMNLNANNVSNVNNVFSIYWYDPNEKTDTEKAIPSEKELQKLVNPNIPKRIYETPIPCKSGKESVLRGIYRISWLGKDTLSYLISNAKSFEETLNNIDYTNIPLDYADRFKSFYSRNDSVDKYTKGYVSDCVNNKVIIEAKFVPYFVFSTNIGGNGVFVRGTLYFLQKEPTNDAWLYKGSTKGKWYQMDMDIEFLSGEGTTVNGIVKYVVRQENYLNAPKLMEDVIK